MSTSLRLSLAALALSPLLFAACASISGLTGPESRSATPFEYTYDETHALAPAQVIRIASEDAEVTITGADRPDVRVRAEYRIASTPRMLQNFAYRLDVASAPAELRIAEVRRTGTRNFKYDAQAHRIQIEVPRHAHVQLTEEDGTCVVTMLAGPIEVTMDDGRVRATDCSGAITVALDNGDFTHFNCTGMVKLQRL